MDGVMENGTLTITLPERMDASNVADAEKEIITIIENNSAEVVVLDAIEMTYISSAGLRVVMRLIKQLKSVSLINANEDIYEIFATTGFTRMMSVGKQ